MPEPFHKVTELIFVAMFVPGIEHRLQSWGCIIQQMSQLLYVLHMRLHEPVILTAKKPEFSINAVIHFILFQLVSFFNAVTGNHNGVQPVIFGSSEAVVPGKPLHHERINNRDKKTFL